MADEDSKSWFSDSDLQEIDKLGNDAFDQGQGSPPPAKPSSPAIPPPPGMPDMPPPPPGAGPPLGMPSPSAASPPPGMPDMPPPPDAVAPPPGADFPPPPGGEQLPPPSEGAVLGTPIDKKSFFKSKLFLIIVVVAVVVIAAGAGAFLFLGGDSKPSPAPKPAPAKKAAPAKVAEPGTDEAKAAGDSEQENIAAAADAKQAVPPPPPPVGSKKAVVPPPPPPVAPAKAKAPTPPPAPAPPPARTASVSSSTSLRAAELAVSPISNGGRIIVRVEGGSVGEVKAFTMSGPRRAVIDIADTSSGVRSVIAGDGSFIDRVRVGDHPEGRNFNGVSMPFLRLVVDMVNDTPISISKSADGNILTITITR